MQQCCPRGGALTTSKQTQKPADAQPLAKQRPGDHGNKLISAFPELTGAELQDGRAYSPCTG